MRSFSVILLLIILFAAYFGANLLAVPAIRSVLGTQCHNTIWFVHCHFKPDEAAWIWANGALAVLAAVAMTLLHRWLRESIIYPFGMLVSGITLALVAIDTAAKRGVLSHDRLVNDTLNALSIILLGSFILTIMIASARNLPVVRLALAIITSFAVKVLAMILFGFIEVAFRGPVELWLLYGIFMWMVFGIHLMGISMALSAADNSSANVESAT